MIIDEANVYKMLKQQYTMQKLPQKKYFQGSSSYHI
jgi:hypothetical protein